ncbi:DUF4230 domain-containing protein [Sphingomonas montanisoli]|uniref:DUF4230 domain-containing protein n=1 Tax=Sphingomonas montanisoli TaxID=2606412 RepID=A0A5D9C9T7_9SPHN|nr:DUF4230 domain-containing protein [Sphingomonas montanisoli]
MYVRRRVGLWVGLATGLTIVVVVALLGWSLGRRYDAIVDPKPETIVSASLQGLREQNRLSAFTASYVAVVTSKQSRFGLSAQKTLIMPGLVRYEVDMARLKDADVRWAAKSKELFVTLPDVETVGPQIDLTRIKEYDSGGLLLRLTDAAQTLDAANRRAGQAELLRQARAPIPMSLARDATRRAVAQNFVLPMRAAGMDAAVRVRFAGEKDFPSASREWITRSRSLEEVYAKP